MPRCSKSMTKPHRLLSQDSLDCEKHPTPPSFRSKRSKPHSTACNLPLQTLNHLRPEPGRLASTAEKNSRPSATLPQKLRLASRLSQIRKSRARTRFPQTFNRTCSCARFALRRCLFGIGWPGRPLRETSRASCLRAALNL